jgi:hypothetical protein
MSRGLVRLLFVKLLEDGTNALVIDDGYGRLIGGVAYLTNYRHTATVMGSFEATTDFHFKWVWYRYVESPEDFASKEGWRHRYLPGPSFEIEVEP